MQISKTRQPIQRKETVVKDMEFDAEMIGNDEVRNSTLRWGMSNSTALGHLPCM